MPIVMVAEASLLDAWMPLPWKQMQFPRHALENLSPTAY